MLGYASLTPGVEMATTSKRSRIARCGSACIRACSRATTIHALRLVVNAVITDRAPLGRYDLGAVRLAVPGEVDPVLFFFKETATPEIYTLSLHDALPI